MRLSRGSVDDNLEARWPRVPPLRRICPVQSTWLEITRAEGVSSVEDLALVLEAVGISSGVVREGGSHVLIVRAEDAERARAEVAKYAAENRGWPHRPEEPLHPLARGRDAAIV